MNLRKYKPDDCRIMAELFYETVHHINKKDYTTEQLFAWASGTVDLDNWNTSFLKHYTVIAEHRGTIVGFGDISADGYLDRLYVHKDYQTQGIASMICSELEHAAGTACISTDASITAKGFFEKRGYYVVRKQQVDRNGILLTNYRMKRPTEKTDPWKNLKIK